MDAKAAKAEPVYRPRNPRKRPLYQCVRRHADELCEAGLVHRRAEERVLERFLDCGDLHKGLTCRTH